MSATIGTFTLRSNITDASLRNPAKIEVADGVTRVSNFALSVGTGSLSVAGAIGNALDLRIIGSGLPLAIANAIRPDLGAAGTLNADIQLSGSASDPAASFKVSAANLSVQQLSAAGISPLGLSAAGRLAGQVITLSSLSAKNGQGINVAASGRVPLSGSGLQVNADGSVPLAIGESFLVTRGTTLSGTLGFKINAGGSLAAPRADGLISLTDGVVTDPLSNLRLERIGLLAGVRGDQISINRMQASLSGGGTISATGQIGLAAGFPANLSVSLNRARYGDGQTFSTVASGDLRVSGQLARDPVLSGTINLSEAEVTVPESFAGDATLLDVKHIAPSPQVRQTLERVAKATPAPTPTSRPSILRLDLAINAPNSIFVRGRGLDAELGGQTRLTGPVTSISPVGGFNLIRGRLEILGKRIDLIQGSITLTGDLDPFLLFVGQTTAADAEAFIRISGRVSDIELSFYSNPELPEDEVLSRIVFDRGLTELTPFQIARLASVAAELSGGKSLSLVNNLRAATGLDDLDVVEDADGNAAVRAGKYLNDNIYLGVQAGQTSKATINLDITNDLTARGSVGTDGDSTIGIFFERDY